jgi:hypothetical protein
MARPLAALLVVLLAAGCGGAGASQAAATPTPADQSGMPSRESMNPAIGAVFAHGDQLAGAWWDAAGWPLHVAYADDDPAVRADVERWLPPGAIVEWDRVSHTYAELDEIQNTITSWWNDNPDQATDMGLGSTGVDVVANVVTVGVTNHVGTFEEPLVARYGDAIRFVIEEPSRPLICDFPESDETPDYCHR